jgi:hypothetical protein
VREPDQDAEERGLGRLQFFDFTANQAWAYIVAFAANFVAWLQLTALSERHAARSWELV